MSSDWISDEDFDEIADEFFDDEQEVASTATEVAAPDTEAAGTPLPYVDQEVAEELVGDGPPTWLGMRWREIPEVDQPAAWNGLRAWVDWLIKEYRLPTAVVPPCWYKHPDITAELYAGMNMEYKVGPAARLGDSLFVRQQVLPGCSSWSQIPQGSNDPTGSVGVDGGRCAQSR